MTHHHCSHQAKSESKARTARHDTLPVERHPSIGISTASSEQQQPPHRGVWSLGGTVELVAAFTAVCLTLYGAVLYLNFLYVRWNGRDGVHRAGSGPEAGPAMRKRDGGGGLDEAALAAMPVFRFKAEARGGGGGGEECAVCLGAMQDGDAVRALPGCRHAFHAGCVDVWLCAHATCPVCRAHPALPVPAAKDGSRTAETAGREPDLESPV